MKPARSSRLPAALTLLLGLLPTSAATFVVTSTANSGAGSLHQAILDANAAAGADVIAFDIATTSKTITPPSSAALPTITEALTIDGTTQPGFAGVPLIELNGSSGPALSNGLLITASDCVIRGLVINRWKGDGIEIQGGANNVVEGCFIGVSLAGTADQGNTLSGVFVNGSASNRIGGTTAAQRNVISGNEDHGVRIEGAASTGNVVQGNLIGLNAAGTAALRNTDHGVSVEGAVNTTIGGTAEGAGNVISGNGQRGISVAGGATGTVIAGNLIGLNRAGETDLGNTQDGIHVAGADGTVIGGSTAADRNVISGNNSDGIELNGATTTGTVIQGNFIGLRSSGTASLNNSTHGVFVNGAVNTTVGGATAGLGNVISGNSQHGIAVTGATTAGTLIQGNLIGLDADGTVDLGNTQDGINVNAVAGTMIGGTAAGAGNRIAGNNGDGLEITGAATQNTVIEGNTIGGDGTPNGGAGILISSSATKNRVGGVNAGQANTLAFNTGDGVFINGGPENTVRGNSIHSNGGLGIDLGGNGIQSNDATDNDTGANLLQNYPVLTEAVLRAAATEVKGTLQTTASATFTLDFYGNDAADASGNGEGQTWLGSTEVTTDATGFAAFTVNLAVTAQRFVSATATDAAGNTSEFSVTRRAVTTAAVADFTVTTTDDSGPGSLRQAILDANAALNEGNRIVFNIPGDGPHTIAPVTALPTLAAPVTLDGTTQPGATANTLAEGFNATLKIILDGNSAPSSTDGLRVEAPRVTVRGMVFHRWKSEAIEVLATAAATVVEGNVIGLGLDSADLGQNSHGVLVSGSPGNWIGGPAPAQRNVISGNGNHGIFLNGAGARDNVIQGNFIGTDLAGTARVVNNGDGVHVTAGNANRIGGPGTGEGNVIGGNNSEGVELENANATVIQGNRLGIAFNGGEIRNGGSGIQFNNASDTLVGGTVAGAGNVIARNSGRGITLLNNTSQRNAFRGNSIFANGNIGIDLFNNGRTLNDAGDADTGPNGMQNFPELASAVTEAAATRITGSFNGAAEATFTLEFFASTEADSTGFGEGEQFLGSAEVTTDAGGLASFDLSLPTRAIGRIITATATGAEGTSEFSATLRASSTIPPLTFTVTTAADDGPGSLRQALLDADKVMTGAPHRIVFNIPGDGPHTISPATALPVLTSEPVEIDGFTQPGASANTLADGFNAVHRIVLDGTAAPFNANGLRFNTAGNVVRGLVIVNFKDDAVRFDGNGNAVEGCLLGLALDGAARPNFRGVRITGTATGNRVGGTTPAARNVIAGNSVSNVELTSSVGVNQVLGNFVGLLPSGSAAPANTDSFFGTSTGIYVQNSPDNVIGGAEPGAGNVIGGHIGMGVEIRDSAAARNRILGNRLGTDVTGQLAVPNQDGIWVVNGPDTVVGGTAAGEGNRLAFNRGNGVTVSGFSTDKDNPVRGNSITGNGELGINLGFGGVLENDPGDADDGANRDQNFPVLTAATAATGSTTIQGTLNSVASRTYALDFFANVACDASGNGEGDQYLGSATVTTEADGNGTFNVTLPVTVVGRFLTATATDPDGNTSEFCDCFEAATGFGSETFLVTNTNDSGDGSLRDALLRNNASVAGSGNRLEFAIPGDGPHVITPASSLPAITHAVIIDGYSQPGAQANTLADGGDAVLKIHLQAGQGFAGVGLELNTTGSLVRGLALTKWFTAILVNGAQNTVQGCYLGLDPAGDNTGTLNSIALNLASGNGHRVGGTAPGERNLISGNGTALRVSGSDAIIEGNWFGLDPSGRLPRGNGQPVQLSGNNHRFGGSDPAARNVVAATGDDGLRLANANDCLVALNFIGTDVTGLAVWGNSGAGVVVTGGSDGNQILGNVIGGSTGAGVFAFSGTVILGNRIGVGVDATTPMPNGLGVFLNGSANRVGGVAAGEANVIAHNRGEGVWVAGVDTGGNAIRGNVIFANGGGLGLNLGSDGVTPNDAGDGDTGPNGFQNYPELTAGTVHGSTVDVAGTLDSAASAAFTLDFYANREADASGYGEGRQYLGSTTVNTGADGRATFNVSFNIIALGRWLTATATDPDGNTSEFSPALRADTTRPGGTFTVTSAGDDGPGTLRQALLDASEVMAGAPHLIRFDIPAPVAPAIVRHVTLPPGVRTIALKSPLPVPGEAVAIDGFTQPGTAANTAADRDDAQRLIHLDGSSQGFSTAGLRFNRAGSSARGLIITGVNGPGVELVGEGGHVVAGCLLAGNQDGVVVRGSSGNRIGGTGRGDRNVIVENQATGVLITGEEPRENVVLGNFLGLDAGGENGAFNADGVRVESGTANRIGGLAPGEANWIAFNRLAGVFLSGGEGTVVRGNRIFANESLGLDLGNRGLLPNDAGDTDTGANGLQNFPVVTAANVVAGGVKVTGTLNAAPNTAYDLDFYHNATCDASGHGEGARHFGTLTVTTDAAGDAAFDAVLAAVIPRGSVTATATGPKGTSEFGQCRVLGTELPAETFLVTTTADAGPGSLRQAILDANVAFTAARNTIAFNLPGEGVQMIQPLSPLPDITQAVDVEGFTQPGAAPATPEEKLNHKILVRLDGEKAGAGTDGLTVAGSGVSVRGLMLTRFAGRGLWVKPQGNVSLQESWVGTAGSTAAGPNGGIARQATPDPFAQGNGGGIYTGSGQITVINSVISGNRANGVEGQDSTVIIQDSRIGPGPGDDSLLGNGGDGVGSLRSAINVANSTVSGNGAFGINVNQQGGPFAGLPITIRDSTISDNGGGDGLGGGVFVNGDGPGAQLPNSQVTNCKIERNDGPGLDLNNLGGVDVTGCDIIGNIGPGVGLDGVTDSRIGANPTDPLAGDRNLIKGNGGGGTVALDVLGTAILHNVVGANNLPVNLSETAPTTPVVEVNPATGEIIVRSGVEVFPPQPPGGASLVIYIPVPDEPGCVQPGPTLQTEVAENGEVRFVVPVATFGNGVAVAVGDFNGDGSTAVFVNPDPPAVDVRVTKTAPSSVTVGEIAEFRVQAIANQSRSGGYKVVLRDVIPAGFEFVSFTSTDSGTTPNDDPNVISVPAGAPDQPAALEIHGFAGFDTGATVFGGPEITHLDVTLRLRAIAPGQFNNTASLLRTEGFTDANSANNSGTATINVQGNEPPADFALNLDLPSGPVSPNSPFNLAVNVQNLGPNPGTSDIRVVLPAGGQFGTLPPGWTLASPNESFVNQAFRDLLGRPANPSELGQFVPGLDSGGPRDPVVDAIVGSPEFRQQTITSVYLDYLNRPASGAEVQLWLPLLADGGTPEQIIGSVLASGEYFASAGENAGSFIQEVYQDVLGRSPAPAELDLGLNELGANPGEESRMDVAESVLTSPEYRRKQIFDSYQDLLRRPPTAEELTTWLEFSESHPDGIEAVRVALSLLAEYLALAGQIAELPVGSTPAGGGTTTTLPVIPTLPGGFSVSGEIMGEQPDPVPENDRAIGQVFVIGPVDYGDAPDQPRELELFGLVPGGYPTLLANGGAGHIIDPQLRLGFLLDDEADGQPNVAADGDDGGLNRVNDDEDGIAFDAPLVPVFGLFIEVPLLNPRAGAEIRLTAQVSEPPGVSAVLQAWIDFNFDGDWNDPGEQVFRNQPVNNGPNDLKFTVPPGVGLGFTYARFRLSSEANLSPGGAARDGEVEDYLVLFEELDFGDALAIHGPAAHIVDDPPALTLGAKADVEDGYQISLNALADDLDTDGDDEDGVTAISPVFAGVVTTLRVTASKAGFLDLWADYNGKNGFEAAPAVPDPTEYVNGSIIGHAGGPLPLAAGVNIVRFRVPDRLVSKLSFLRFRFTSVAIPNLGPVALAPDGEVEDYLVQFYGTLPDFGDAPDGDESPRYPTLLKNNGAFHLVTEDRFFLGQRVDVEPDGFPSADALGDDQDNGLENPASPEPDDEEGVRFLTPLTPGQPASVQLVVTLPTAGPAFVNAWVDFNADFDWADAGEQVLVNAPMVHGTNVVSLAVPAGARPGNTYARFRLTRDQGTGFAGVATSGEVEDYLVTVAEPAGELRLDSIVQVGSDVELRWAGNAVLESAPSVNGPWIRVPGATSPFRTPMGDEAARFYRLASP